MKGLAPHTLQIFEAVSQLDCIKPYLLVGGTALSLQIGTRQSEDLDFMKWRTSKIEKMEVAWYQIEKELATIGEIQHKDILDIDHVEYLVSGVKFSFYACPKYSPVSEPVSYLNNLKLADVKSIGAMKMEVLLRRSNFRDYYDIYSILKSGVPVNDLISLALSYSGHRLKSKNLLAMLTNSNRFTRDSHFEQLVPAGIPAGRRKSGSVRIAQALVEGNEHLFGALGDDGAGPKDTGGAMLIEEGVVLRRDDAAGDDHDILAAALFELLHQGGQQSLVAGGQGGHAHDVHVVVHSLLRCLLRGLEKGTDVHVEAHIGVSGRDHLGAAVVAVLAHLGDHDAGPAALALLELIGHLADFLDLGAVGELAGIYAGDGVDDGLVAAGDLFNGHRNLSQTGAGAGGLHGQLQQVPLAGLHGFGDGVEALIHLLLAAHGAQLLQAGDLRLTDGGVVHFQDVDGVLVVQRQIVQTDDLLLAGVDVGLTAGGGFLDAHLGQAVVDGLGHAAQLLHLLDVAPGAADQLVGKGLHVVRAAPGIDDLADLGLILDVELGVAGDAGGEVGGQGDGLVHVIGIQVQRVDGFLSGLCAANYDVTDICIDATLKIGGRDYEALADFIASVNKLSELSDTRFIFTISADESELPTRIFDVAAKA